jgi:hypothetical protein
MRHLLVLAVVAPLTAASAQGGDTAIVRGAMQDTIALSARAATDTMKILGGRPKLACTENPASKVNFASMKARVRCANCKDGLNEVLGWGQKAARRRPLAS